MLYMYVCVRTVSPDAIHEHVKTKIEGTKRMHYTAPEYAGEGMQRQLTFEPVASSLPWVAEIFFFFFVI